MENSIIIILLIIVAIVVIAFIVHSVHEARDNERRAHELAISAAMPSVPKGTPTPEELQQQQQRSNPSHISASDDEYTKLLKKYYLQYGDYIFEMDDLMRDIKFACNSLIDIDKTLQEIRFDLLTVGKNLGNIESPTKTGIWLEFLGGDGFLIHPVNQEVGTRPCLKNKTCTKRENMVI